MPARRVRHAALVQDVLHIYSFSRHGLCCGMQVPGAVFSGGELSRKHVSTECALQASDPEVSEPMGERSFIGWST